MSKKALLSVLGLTVVAMNANFVEAADRVGSARKKSLATIVRSAAEEASARDPEVLAAKKARAKADDLEEKSLEASRAAARAAMAAKVASEDAIRAELAAELRIVDNEVKIARVQANTMRSFAGIEESSKRSGSTGITGAVELKDALRSLSEVLKEKQKLLDKAERESKEALERGEAELGRAQLTEAEALEEETKARIKVQKLKLRIEEVGTVATGRG